MTLTCWIVTTIFALMAYTLGKAHGLEGEEIDEKEEEEEERVFGFRGPEVGEQGEEDGY